MWVGVFFFSFNSSPAPRFFVVVVVAVYLFDHAVAVDPRDQLVLGHTGPPVR